MVLVVTITGGNTQHIISYYSIAIVHSIINKCSCTILVCSMQILSHTMSYYVIVCTCIVLLYCIVLYCILFYVILLHYIDLHCASCLIMILLHIISSEAAYIRHVVSVWNIYIRLPSISSLACFHFFSSNKHRKVTVDSGTSRRDHTKLWSTSYQNGGVQALDLIPRFGCVYKLYSRIQYTID